MLQLNKRNISILHRVSHMMHIKKNNETNCILYLVMISHPVILLLMVIHHIQEKCTLEEMTSMEYHCASCNVTLRRNKTTNLTLTELITQMKNNLLLSENQITLFSQENLGIVQMFFTVEQIH